MLERVWPQNGLRINLTGSGGPSYIQVGPRGSDFRGPGALKLQFKAPKTQNRPTKLKIHIKWPFNGPLMALLHGPLMVLFLKILLI